MAEPTVQESKLGKLWRALYQVSTIKGIIRALSAAGIIHLAPAAQDQIVTLIVQIIGGGQALVAVIDIFRNEHKSPIINTTGNVSIAGPATVETTK